VDIPDVKRGYETARLGMKILKGLEETFSCKELTFYAAVINSDRFVPH
jgi:hypothetical protein